jgi:hypothetical protein
MAERSPPYLFTIYSSLPLACLPVTTLTAGEVSGPVATSSRDSMPLQGWVGWQATVQKGGVGVMRLETVSAGREVAEYNASVSEVLVALMGGTPPPLQPQQGKLLPPARFC